MYNLISMNSVIINVPPLDDEPFSFSSNAKTLKIASRAAFPAQ